LPCRRERPKDIDLANHPPLFHGAPGTDRSLAAEGKKAREAGVRGHQVKRCLAAVVHRFGHAIAFADQLHVRVLLAKIGDGVIRPGVVQRHGEAADKDGILALAAHLLRQKFGMRLAKALGRGQFEVPVDVLETRPLMADDLDARRACLFKDGLQRGLVVRHHADDVDALGDQVLDRTDLQCRIGAGRPDHRGIDAQFGTFFKDPHLHGVEPGNAADLHDNAHGGLVLGQCPRGKGGGKSNARHQRAKGSSFHDLPPVKGPQKGRTLNAASIVQTVFKATRALPHHLLCLSLLPGSIKCTIDIAY